MTTADRSIQQSGAEPGGNGAPIPMALPVSDLPGVGPARARALGRLGIFQVSHLLRHLPVRYEREAAEGAIADLPDNQHGTARGVIAAARAVPGGYGRKGRFEVTLREGGDTLTLVWFGAVYLREKLHPGMNLRVHGKSKPFLSYRQMVNPRFEILEEDLEAEPARPARLRPVYPATEDLSSLQIEKLVDAVLPGALAGLEDPMPQAMRTRLAMPDLAEAFRMAHRPLIEEEHHAARRRLAFNELLLLQLGIQLKRAYVRERLTAPALSFNEAIDQRIKARFPFTPTAGQAQAMRDLAEDLSQTRPANRLIQGDVGSGKTLVALYALLLAVVNRKQGALMAPTELLAEQHYAGIQRLLAGSDVRIELLTGALGTRSAARRALLERIASGQTDLVIGTHALVSDDVVFQDLAVAVVDEQHRFGVHQRARFRTGRVVPPGTDGRERLAVPHQLVMTATPIPRSLGLTVFGDLDSTLITGLPPGRVPIVSRYVGPEKSEEVYRYLRKRLEQGEQAYVVVPAIEAGGESGQELKSVAEHAAQLRQKYCQGFEVAEVHGRLKREEREAVMERFRRGEAHVLVATTVIEVGVDVPNATVMVIEHAERFGLAQLHQLRGRVGRGGDGRKSLCVFIGEPTTDEGIKRLEVIASTRDGFKIAEMDLEIRGMGEFFGTRQSGATPLRVARIPNDMDLLQMARREAETIMTADPTLVEQQHLRLRHVLLHQYGESLGLVDVG